MTHSNRRRTNRRSNRRGSNSRAFFGRETSPQNSTQGPKLSRRKLVSVHSCPKLKPVRTGGCAPEANHVATPGVQVRQEAFDRTSFGQQQRYCCRHTPALDPGYLVSRCLGYITVGSCW